MNKNIFLSVLCLIALAFSSCSSTRHTSSKKLPPMSELSVIFDSIVNEGYQLYYSDRANWVATDLVFEKHDMEELGRSVSWKPNDSIWAVLFFDKDEKNCVFESHFNFYSNEYYSIDSIRPISSEEMILLERKYTLIAKAVDKYGNNMMFAPESFGNPNIDVIQINDQLTRVYFLQGTIQNNTIPFGNDYSVDFDENLEPVAFRKYHNSLIACPTKSEDGDNVKIVWHSHLKDNPFITPTDICNFLLYCPQYMNGFCVLSTAYGCYFTFLRDQHCIVVQ